MMDQKHKCKFCDKSFETGQKLGTHIAFIHKRNQKAINEALIRKRITITRICEVCGNKFDIEQIVNKDGSIKLGGRRRCSTKCSKTREFTKEQNKKKGGNRKRTCYNRVCEQCGKPFTTTRKKKRFCNRSCAITFRNKQPQNKLQWLKICIKTTSHKALSGVTGIRKDVCKKTKFKSSWEADFARILNYNGLKWEYEPKTFKLKDGRNYTPDFRVNGSYIEIKNFLRKSDVNRHELFAECNERFYLICGYQIFYGLISLYIDNIRFECETKARRSIQSNDIDVESAKKIFAGVAQW